MSYYRTCPSCGANLDPGEQCECTVGNDDISSFLFKATRENANRRRYAEIRDFLRRNGLSYADLSVKIGYPEQTFKQYMHKLKRGESGSRFIWRNIKQYADGVVYGQA